MVAVIKGSFMVNLKINNQRVWRQSLSSSKPCNAAA